MNGPRPPIILDGPLGTELAARGVQTPPPAWSAHAIRTAPQVISRIHAEYAAAGASVHTTCTFRTRPEAVGERWRSLAAHAVGLARGAVPAGHRIAGSVAPLADCYRPDLAPPEDDARGSHRALCRALAKAGVDILLCETFSNLREGLVAVECALETGRETWAAFTPGPEGNISTPEEIAGAGAEAAGLGASAVLVNCVAASGALPYVEALVESCAGLDVLVGVYANGGGMEEGIGWGAGPEGAGEYAALALEWWRAGALVIGGCCGTTPLHIERVVERLRLETSRE